MEHADYELLRKRLRKKNLEGEDMDYSYEEIENNEPERYKNLLYKLMIEIGEMEKYVEFIEDNLMESKEELDKLQQTGGELSKRSHKSGSSDIAYRLEEIENKLLENEVRMLNHQEQTELELISLMKQILESEESEPIDKRRISEYLRELEQQLSQKEQADSDEYVIAMTEEEKYLLET